VDRVKELYEKWMESAVWDKDSQKKDYKAYLDALKELASV
jgi:quinol monooxygenase YgiN